MNYPASELMDYLNHADAYYIEASLVELKPPYLPSAPQMICATAKSLDLVAGFCEPI